MGIFVLWAQNRLEIKSKCPLQGFKLHKKRILELNANQMCRQAEMF